VISVKIVGANGLNGRNLVAGKPGLACRISIVGMDGKIDPAIFRTLDKCLSGINKQIFPVENRLNLPALKNDVSSFVTFICKAALQLQMAAGSPVEIYRFTRSADHTHWDLFTEYEFERVGRHALSASLMLVRAAIAALNDNRLPPDMDKLAQPAVDGLRQYHDDISPAREVKALLNAANIRNIPWRELPQSGQFHQYGYGVHNRIFCDKILDTEGHNTFRLTDNKAMTSTLLNDFGLPTAKHKQVSTVEQALAFARDTGYPVVLKPLVGMEGTGVTPNIQNDEDVIAAFEYATKYHQTAIMEQHTMGDDYRMLVFGGKFVGCIKRAITVLEGDGIRTIDELVEEVNRQPWRTARFGTTKYQIRKMPIIARHLERQGYRWSSIPAEGARVSMHIVPNISQGGTVSTIWDGIHPSNITMAERAAKIFDLKMAGVDFLTTDIGKPYWESGGTICEVNANPAFALMFDSQDEHINRLGKIAFELSCPPDEEMDLPVIVMVGRDPALGADISERLTAKGLTVGYHSLMGAKIGTAPFIHTDNASKSVASVLWNPAVEAVVIHEDGRRIQRHGLEYDICSHMVVTGMPTLNSIPAPEILDMILQTVTHQVLVNTDDDALVDWANGKSNSKIRRVSADDLSDDIMSVMHSDFPNQVPA